MSRLPAGHAAWHALRRIFGRNSASAGRGGRSAADRALHQRAGRWAEALAALALVLKGYRIIERRRRARAGEIDLIVQRGRRVAFVEVKWRPTLADAEGAVSWQQAARIARSAESWLWRYRAFREAEIGLDSVLVAPWSWPRHRPGALQR